MKKNDTRLKELDFIRVIACLSVIIVHVSAFGVTGYLKGSPHLIITTLINRSLKYTTPVFLFLSGVTSFYSYRNKEFNYFDFLKKRLPKILIPYLVWNIIYFLYFIILGYDSFNFTSFVKNILLGTMYYHLYFIVILIQLYFLSFVFSFLFRKYNFKKLITISSIIAIIAIVTMQFVYSDRIFIKYFVYYLLGIFVTKNYNKFINFIYKNSQIIISLYLIICLIYSGAYYFYYSSTLNTSIWFFFSIISILFLYYIGLILNNKFTKSYRIVKRLSKSSYYIYLSHPLVLTIIVSLISRTSIQSLTFKLLIYISVTVTVPTLGSVIYTILKDKFISYKKEKKSVAK